MKCLKNLAPSEITTLERILQLTALKVNDYNYEMKKMDPMIISGFNFTLNYRNERSIAYAFTEYLYGNLSMVFPSTTVLNEAAIKLDSTIDAVSEASILDLVENNEDDSLTKRQRMYPDALLQIIDGINEMYLFVEYKVNDKFKYFSLAADLIKFMIYTTSSSKKSYFMYVVFNRENYVTIAPSGSLKYQILDNSITKSTVDINANIFLYDFCSHNNLQRVETKRNLNESLVCKFNSLIKITETIDEIYNLNLSDNDIVDAENFLENPYYQNIDSFSPNVITAKVIRDNYSLIIEIYNFIKNNQIDIPLQEDTRITVEQFISGSIENDTSFIKKTVVHFKNQLKNQLGTERDRIDDTAFNVNYRKSYWILSVIFEFIELNNIVIVQSRDIYESTKILIENNLERLDSGYRRNENQRSLNTLAISLIHFIRALYQLIYIETRSGLKENNEYKAFKKRKILLKQIKKMKKLVLDKERMSDLDWDFSIEEFGLEVLEHIIKIIDHDNYLE